MRRQHLRNFAPMPNPAIGTTRPAMRWVHKDIRHRTTHLTVLTI